MHQRNCTGNPDKRAPWAPRTVGAPSQPPDTHVPRVADLAAAPRGSPFNKPKVDLGAAALAFRPADECNVAAEVDGAERALDECLALYGGRFRRT